MHLAGIAAGLMLHSCWTFTSVFVIRCSAQPSHTHTYLFFVLILIYFLFYAVYQQWKNAVDLLGLSLNLYIFRVCKFVHHHTFIWINQQDAATSQVYYLSFKYSSTCFGHPRAHHEELQQLQKQPLVCRRSLVIAVLLVVVGPSRVGPTTTNSTAITKLRR